jgi:membrane protease YdiL (CAAX protease family)
VRAFGWFLGSVLLALLIGAIVAYPAYLLVAPIGGWAFHRVAGRVAMLILAGELVWLCRHLRIESKRDFGFGLPWRRFVAQSALWGAVGTATAAAGAAFLLGARLRVPDPGLVLSSRTLLHLLLTGVGSGVTVALIEETVMRGAMHTAIERESGAWTAALLTAPLYAVLHFFAKASIPPDRLAWRSGFDLLAYSFAPLSHPSAVFDAFLAWLVVGLVLSLTRVLSGNIAVAIGLHAGWVLVLRMLQEGTVRGTSPAYAAWVGRFDGLLGYWLLPWAGAIGLALWLTRRRWVPAARGASR